MLKFPADWLWRFNFVTVALRALEYLKRLDKAIPAYGAVTKPTCVTSGCKYLDYILFPFLLKRTINFGIAVRSVASRRVR